MEHRRFLAHPESHRSFVGGGLLQRIGGRAAVETLVDGLYDRIDTDVELRPLFSRNLSNEREAQKRFFTEWLGGVTRYSDHTHLPLKHRHDLLPITRTLAEKWLAHFREALNTAVSDDEACHAIQDKVHVLAMALVNEGAERSALRARPHGTCLRYEPAIESLALARRGDAAAHKTTTGSPRSIGLSGLHHRSIVRQFDACFTVRGPNSYGSRSGSCISGRRGHSPGD
jgi:truncated hemoglobin YjbI